MREIYHQRSDHKYSHNLNQLNMDSHEPHIAKPKIAKNASSRLPEAFRMQASTRRAENPVEDTKNPTSEARQIRQGREAKQPRQSRKQKKSKNPFLPIKQFIKKAEQFAKQMREANSDFNLERFAKYSFEGGKTGKIKYENCITLSIVRRSNSGCLKKVLHVPTLSVHFLRESLISAHIDKNELTEWIGVVNREDNPQDGGIKILELFWNMPEDYYSLLYDYSEGLLLDSLAEGLHSLPVGLLRDLAAAHFSANVGVFNSHLLLHEENGSKTIRYLPLYQEGDFTFGQSQSMRRIIESQLPDSQPERRFIWRLGVMLLNGYLGSIITIQLPKVTLPLKKCCLLHQIISSTNSLANIYIAANGLYDEWFNDFLCRCLRSRRWTEKEGAVEMRALRNSRFLARKYGEIISLEQMIQIVDPTSESKSKFELSKMSRILDSIALILQNVNTSSEFIINNDSKGVLHLARQLGMSREIDKMVNQLRKVYRHEH